MGREDIVKKTIDKSMGTIVLTGFFLMLMFIAAFGFMSYVSARAATNTGAEGTWSTQKTQNLIPVLHEGDVREQGWNIDEPDAQATAAERDGGWAILAGDGGPDLGNKDYTGGVYYVIELSEEDQAKAQSGQLSVSASARTWIQGGWATHHLSIRAEFFNTSDISGVGFHTEKATFEPGTKISDRVETISLDQRTVPSGTVKIKMWFSNQGSLDGKPWLGSMACYLHDSTAPSFTEATLDDAAITDPVKNIAVGGNTVKYRIGFNEKVSVIENGTANLTLNGSQFAASSSVQTIENNGKTQVEYTFTLPENESSGTLAFSSVSGLKVKDEAGNEFTYSGSPTLETLNYYGTMSVTAELTRLETDGADTAKYGTDYSAVLRPVKGYELPSDVEITVGGAALSSENYKYDVNNGSITVYGFYITGDIIIKAAGKAKESAVVFDKQNGSGGTDSVTAVYDGNMPEITVPARKGYTFNGYYSESGGNGTKYYDEAGKGVKICDFDASVRLYAYWTANRYRVNFDKNKPATASGNVTGNITAAQRTYDDGEISLPLNDFKLEGWTFTGWAKSENGAVDYYDGQAVSNLTDVRDGTVTLFAVWEENSYTVNYDANKPAEASAETVGVTASSSHKYDTLSALSANGFTLAGWTFTGWAASSDGEKAYDDNAVVSKLTEANGGEITLYAVWKPNTYTVKYNANQPTGASGAVSGITAETEHTYDAAKNLGDNSFSLTGWTFSGWALDPLSDKADFINGESIKNLTETQGEIVALYAVWKPNVYSVNFDKNKPDAASSFVEGNMENSAFTYDTESGLPANAYSLKGWTFSGWSRDNDGTADYKDCAAVKNLTSVPDGTVTLYAVWQENTYTLSFDTEGGTFADSIEVKYDNGLPAVNPPVRKGYNFQGYYTLPDGGGIKYFNGDGTTADISYTVAENTLIYAYWLPIRYNIELYSNGEYVTVIENVVYGSLRLPSATELGLERDNFDFVGWNLYEDQNWSMYFADTEYSAGLAEAEGETVTLYAAWLEKDRFTINFDANGGIGAPAMAQAHEDETVILSETVPSRKNYTFIGWATESAAQNARFFPGDEFTMGNSVVTLYAVWKHNPSLSYDANGGTFTSEAEIIYPAAGESVLITALIPKLEGRVFMGWSEERDSASATLGAGDEFIMPETDTVLYAVWESAQYSVTFSAAENYSVVGLNEKYFYNETASFSVIGSSPKVYINGQLAIKGEDGLYSFTVKDNTHVFVADGLKLSLIYSANGGVGAPSDNNAYDFGSQATVSFIKPERIGYTFIGWSVNQNAESAKYNAGSAVAFTDENIVLYAVWQANTYTVSYNPDSGTGNMESDVFTFGKNETLSKNAFEKTGHTFIGWALSPSGEVLYGDGAEVTDLLTENNGTIVLYAVWEKTVTVISFAADDGTEINSPLSVAYGEELSSDGLVVPVRGGYLFKGYYTQSDGAGEMIFDAELNVAAQGVWDKNVTTLTLHPYWTPITYTVVYMDGQKISGKQSAVYGIPFNLNYANDLGIAAQEGFHFAGWSAIPSGQIAAYTDGQTIYDALTLTNGDEVCLYAVFEADEKFTVTYNANGGINAPVDNNTYLAGDTVTISDIIPRLEGYVFGGWSYDPNSDIIDFPYENGRFTTESAAMSEGGMSLYAVWIAGETLQEQIDGLKNQASSLSDAIAALETADDDFSDELNRLGTELTEAQNTLAVLDNTYATDEELSAAINQLEELLTLADTNLEQKITKLQEKLDGAVADLTQSLAANKTDIESKLAALDTAYKAADALINSDIAALESANEELKQSIAELQSAYKAADTNLQNAINSVQENLDGAVAELTQSLAANKTDIESKLAALDTAYKAADALINSDIAALESADGELKQSIAELQSAYKAADEALWAGIRQVQENLDALKLQLEEKDDGLEEKLNSLIYQNEKTSFVYMIVNIILGVVAAILIVTLIVKAIKKKNSQG